MSMTLEEQITHACLQARACRHCGDEVQAAYWHERVTQLCDLMDRETAREQVYERGVS